MINDNPWEYYGVLTPELQMKLGGVKGAGVAQFLFLTFYQLLKSRLNFSPESFQKNIKVRRERRKTDLADDKKNDVLDKALGIRDIFKRFVIDTEVVFFNNRRLCRRIHIARLPDTHNHFINLKLGPSPCTFLFGPFFPTARSSPFNHPFHRTKLKQVHLTAVFLNRHITEVKNHSFKMHLASKESLQIIFHRNHMNIRECLFAESLRVSNLNIVKPHI